MAERVKRENHAIICGYGVVGQKIVEVLKEHGVPFVVVDNDEKVITKIRELGYDSILGDATSSKVLRDVGIENARVIAVAMDNDAKDLFTVITARDLNKKIFIATRANESFVREKLIEAGADYVVMPEQSASDEIMEELLKT